MPKTPKLVEYPRPSVREILELGKVRWIEALDALAQIHGYTYKLSLLRCAKTTWHLAIKMEHRLTAEQAEQTGEEVRRFLVNVIKMEGPVVELDYQEYDPGIVKVNRLPG